MGYTHYWYLNPNGDEKNYSKAKRAIAKIIRSRKHSVSLGDGCGNRGSKPVIDGKIWFNGIEENSHETFCLFDKLADLENENENSYVSRNEKGYVFTFCKTAYKPYDVVVTACLIALRYYMGNDVRVNSDGEKKDWFAGLRLAKDALGLKKLHIPELNN